MIEFSVMGAGRLGRTWARLAHLSGHYRIGTVWCRRREQAQEAVAFIGAGTPRDGTVPPLTSGLTLLSVVDDALPELAAQLSEAAPATAGGVVFHASGVLERTVLAPLAARGWACASLHPAFSFAEPARAVVDFAGTLCAMEADVTAQAPLHAFAQAIGAVPFTLAPGGKARYHASLAVASNYLVTLSGLARSLACQAGIAPEQVPALLVPLMRQSLDNAMALGPSAALTGPIARGDVQTVARHLQALADPAARELYCALGRATLALAAPRLTPAAQQSLARLLAADGEAVRC